MAITKTSANPEDAALSVFSGQQVAGSLIFSSSTLLCGIGTQVCMWSDIGHVATATDVKAQSWTRSPPSRVRANNENQYRFGYIPCGSMAIHKDT